MIYARILAAAALAVATPELAQAALSPAGNHYRLNIKTSFENPFSDCWTFSNNGTFIHSPSLKNFTYRLDNLNTQAGGWQAIWVGRVSIAFAGSVSGATITGNAVDANGRTYSFTGNSVSGCNTAAATGAGWAK